MQLRFRDAGCFRAGRSRPSVSRAATDPARTALSHAAIIGVRVEHLRGAARHHDWAGYAYVDAGGHIGPVAVLQSNAVAIAFRTALRLAVESGASQVSAFLPAASEAALNAAIDHGMRIKFPMLLMSSRDFGNWTQYLPRNPGFM